VEQHPWDEQKFYSPKEVGGFFGRGDDWARARFRDLPGVLKTRAVKPRRRVRDDFVSLSIPGWVITRFYNRNSGSEAA
jgi:hypothetical protein